MTQKIKNENVLAAYQVLSQAKYGKLSDEEKIKVWKIARALKPVADGLNETIEDANAKFKPEGYDEELQKFNTVKAMMRDANADMTTAPMGVAEADQWYINVFTPYQKLVNDAVSEFSKQEVEILFEKLSEEVFGKLMASNEWTMGQVVMLGEMICE